jgi:hypothetical protein
MDPDNTLTFNGHLVEFHEMAEDGRIRFKMDPVWRQPWDFIIPGCTAFDFIMRMHRLGHTEAKPMGFWSKELKGVASNSEVRRWLDNSAIRFNGKPLKPKDMLDFPLYSIVLFPKAERITIL